MSTTLPPLPQKTMQLLAELRADYNADHMHPSMYCALNHLSEQMGLWGEPAVEAVMAWAKARGLSVKDSPYSECQLIR